MSAGALSAADLAQIAARGIGREEIERQLRLHASPPDKIRLERPCTLGDGIEGLAAETAGGRRVLAERAAAEGRLTVFVPASGAATRMFETLLAWPRRGPLPAAAELGARADAGERAAADLVRLVAELPGFAFYDELRELFARRGKDLEEARAARRYGAILGGLLDPDGLGLAELPKALVPFHRRDRAVLTAFEEQLAEAARYTADAGGLVRVHFTLAPEFTDRCRALAARFAPRLAPLRAEVTFSSQSPSTDTLAATLDARPFRLADDTLLFRPGGHGALLPNLAALGADLVAIKNVDNVLPEEGREPVVHWRRQLVGRLLDVRAEVDRLIEALADESAIPGARRFAVEVLGVDPGADGAALLDRLDRPLRVCGVVRNAGEPGGGPFWVRRGTAVTRQIVESSQVDLDDPGQRAIWSAATHFNPVDIVAALRDGHGRAYDLREYVDPDAVFLSLKSHGGEPLRALELPGLWNGAMAGWNTVFVEVPAATFAPVKTLFDLLRPEHRGA